MDYAQVVTKGNNGGSHIVKYSDDELRSQTLRTLDRVRSAAKELTAATENITKARW